MKQIYTRAGMEPRITFYIKIICHERRRLLAAVPAREQRVPLPAGFVSLGRYSAPRSDSGCFGRRQSVLSWFWLWF